MTLITNPHLLNYLDRLAWVYSQAFPVLGSVVGGPVTGTTQGTMANLLADLVAGGVYQEIADLAGAINAAVPLVAFETFAAALTTLLQQNSSGTLYQHIFKQGPAVNAAIVSLATYLTYYNTTPFSCLATPDFAKLWLDLGMSALPPAGVMSPALQPDYNPAASAHGMGDYDIATTTYTHGTNVNTTLYSAVVPVVEVTTTFSGGGAHPTVQIAGTDDLGAPCTLNAALNLGTNNPAAALSGLTVTPAITVAARQTVVVSSSAGIVVGSVITINKGLPDQEVVVVEGVPDGTHIKAVFRLAHLAAATIDGWTSFVAGNLSTGAGRRLASLNNSSGITLSLSSHSAGKVRIAGQQDRVAT